MSEEDKQAKTDVKLAEAGIRIAETAVQLAKNQNANEETAETLEEEDLYFGEEDEKQFKEETKTEEVIDFSSWSLAQPVDLNLIRATKKLKKLNIPIHFEKKIFIQFFVRELTMDEQFDLLEKFFTFDTKSGDAKMDWKSYYRYTFERMVVKTVPPIKWNKAKYYTKEFLGILMKYLPNTLDLASQAPGAKKKIETG